MFETQREFDRLRETEQQQSEKFGKFFNKNYNGAQQNERKQRTFCVDNQSASSKATSIKEVKMGRDEQLALEEFMRSSSVANHPQPAAPTRDQVTDKSILDEYGDEYNVIPVIDNRRPNLRDELNRSQRSIPVIDASVLTGHSKDSNPAPADTSMTSKVDQKWEQFVQEAEAKPVQQQPVQSEHDSQKFKDIHTFHEEASESDKWEDLPASNKSEAHEPSQTSAVELEEIKEQSHEATPPKQFQEAEAPVQSTPVVEMAPEPKRMQEVSPYAE